jgi:ribose transport system substrate-binding protein
MSRISKRRSVATMAAIAALASLLVLLLPGVSGGKTVKAGKQQETYKFVLSNNFLGNDWRPQMERLAQLTSQLAPFKGKIALQIVNSQTTTEAQIADLNNIIASKPDVILLDAGSPTALNPVVKRACAAGIKVISFDQPVTESCAWRVYQDHGLGQRAVGQWMAKVLKNQGGIFVDRGLPGAPISQVIHDNFLKGLHQYGPNVKVLAEYDGKYSIGPEQQAVSSLLAGHSDVAGVHTQGYCTPIFNAFKQAGMALVPCTAYGYNGELVACVQNKVPCAILSGSPVVVQIAMKLALDALEGKATPPKSKVVAVPMYLFLTGPKIHLENAGVETQYVKLGSNAFPDLAPGLALPYTLTQYKITPQQAAAKRG